MILLQELVRPTFCWGALGSSQRGTLLSRANSRRMTHPSAKRKGPSDEAVPIAKRDLSSSLKMEAPTVSPGELLPGFTFLREIILCDILRNHSVSIIDRDDGRDCMANNLQPVVGDVVPPSIIEKRNDLALQEGAK